MKTKITILALIIFSSGIWNYNNAFNNSSTDEIYSSNLKIVKQTAWELIKDKQAIKTYSQWIELNDGKKTRRLKGQFQVQIPISQIITILRDSKNIQKWMEGTIKSFGISNQNYEWTSYAKFNIPWPFDDQDFVVKNKLVYQELDKTAYVFIQSSPNEFPREEGVKRMESFSGKWKLTSLSNNSTLIEYSAFSLTEPLAPRWIQDPIVQNTFWNSLKNFSDLCQTSNIL